MDDAFSRLTLPQLEATGRGDGESYQIGLLDICDTPYPETIRVVREVGYDMYQYHNTRGIQK